MAMMFIMEMGMVVLSCIMVVRMFVPFADMQPDTDAHKDCRPDKL